MGNPYPVSFETPQGSGRLTGQVNFTDPANQPGGGTSAVAAATVTVTPAQWLNLVNAGVTLVSAPGVGEIIVPLACVLALNWNSVAYTGTADDVQIVLGDPLGASATMWDLDVLSATLLAATQDQYLFVQSSLSQYTDQRTGTNNAAPNANEPLSLINFGTAIATGNSPVAVTTYYATLTLP